VWVTPIPTVRKIKSIKHIRILTPQVTKLIQNKVDAC
jgi:hypothetical protein